MVAGIRKQVAQFTDGDLSGWLLRDLRIASSVLCRSVLAPPWGFSVDARDAGSFHVMLAGEAMLEVDGAGEPIRLGRGDVVVLPRGNGHRLRDSSRSEAPKLTDILAERPVVDGELRLGSEAPPTGEVVCGTFTVDGGRPAWFGHLRPAIVSARPSENGAWRDALAHALGDEARSPTPGGAGTVNRWLESILGDALRADVGSNGGDAVSAGAADQRIGRVLGLVHDRPAERWTLAALADAATMSRSSFADRFRSVVGEPPGAYVTRVRLDRARQLLQSTDATIADIADRVGYGSGEALSRAFKARYGRPPSGMRWPGAVPAAGAS